MFCTLTCFARQLPKLLVLMTAAAPLGPLKMVSAGPSLAGLPQCVGWAPAAGAFLSGHARHCRRVPARPSAEDAGMRRELMHAVRKPQLQQLAGRMSAGGWRRRSTCLAGGKGNRRDESGAETTRLGEQGTEIARGKAVVLLSGGVESTTLLYSMHKQAVVHGGSVLAVFTDYGQRGGAREREASRAACHRLGITLVELEAGQVGEAFRARQKQRLHVPVPHRNLLILSLALSLAAQEGAAAIALALQAGDVGWYPSASLDFVSEFRKVCSIASAHVQAAHARCTVTLPPLILPQWEDVGESERQTWPWV